MPSALLMKEGREFGVGTILSTQELTHFKTANNDYSGYILSWIIHRVANIKSQDVKAMFNAASKDEIDRMRPSPTSLMPKSLLDTLNRDEVLDLLAFLLSRGNPNDVMFER